MDLKLDLVWKKLNKMFEKLGEEWKLLDSAYVNSKTMLEKEFVLEKQSVIIAKKNTINKVFEILLEVNSEIN